MLWRIKRCLCCKSTDFFHYLESDNETFVKEYLIVNTFIADEEFFRHNRENLPLPIQMQLSKKPKMFCCYFIAFLRSIFNFQRFENKNEPHSLSISEIIDSERRGYLNALKVLSLKTLPQSTCERVPKTERKAIFSHLFIILSQNELEKVILIQI